MMVYFQGRFLAAEQARLSISDRGFLYGDGLFETVRAYSGELFLWEQHAARFFSGCEALGLRSPLSPNELRKVCGQLLQVNRQNDALLRITLTRGEGPRGYSPAGADHPSLVIASFPAPEPSPSLHLITSRFRFFAGDPLAGFKHTSKLTHALAKSEAEAAGANDALFLDHNGNILETTGANIFWVKANRLYTPPLTGILPGLTRALVLRLCAQCGIPAEERTAALAEILACDGAFLTSTGLEIARIASVDGQPLGRHRWIAQLQRRFRAQTARRTQQES
jgi:aminodeoxychorismate lyase